MKIKDLGGEFALIERLTSRKPYPGVVVGVGDDAAVLEFTDDEHLLVTTDLLNEGDHFTRDWSTPEQIGLKCMESNVSDIAAMGGTPSYAFISVSLTDDVDVEFMDGLYAGFQKSLKRHDFIIAGGDTTHGKNLSINVCIIGKVGKTSLCLRSSAKVGDIICVTGDLGKSKAGLELLRRGIEGDVKAHLEPHCRLKEARNIAPHANAMIDVSDGLASEIGHISRESNVGAIIHSESIPISESTRITAKKLGADALDYALHGGEDFELVFTIGEKKLGLINPGCPVAIVGEVTEKSGGVLISKGGSISQLKGGFNHFG